ncbi:ubiquitin-conjugating enzyme E2-24 kDa [Favolaschia claudopus]|uniref:Ubiquitin-conjugating enzyme E2 1 n=1 Tax=Favolaschia claudopus TaxID=2862362 RepID=A0AAW0A7K8_9AGAR
MDARLRRVNKEIADCKNDKTSNIRIDLVDSSPFHLIGSFPGPSDTPYAGGLFKVDIVIPDSYPFQPVKMKFITKVYHPNVSSASGAICLDILKDAWSPVLTLKSTLISLQSLLCSPEPDDPQDAEVAKHYTASRRSFEETAVYWTKTYAVPEAGEEGRRDDIAIAGLERPHVERFEALGFARSKVCPACLPVRSLSLAPPCFSPLFSPFLFLYSRQQQIDVLRRLNYRGANVAQINDDRIVEELLK